jgi:hypothetical protein
MVTKRDEKVLEFISKFKAANSKTISTMFYPSLRVAQNRLVSLTKYNLLSREKIIYNNEYVYYIKKTSQLRHNIILSTFYCKLYQIATIHYFIVEPTIENIRPDALIAYTLKEDQSELIKLGFVEIEISNKGFNMARYERLFSSGDYKKRFPIFPKLIIVTNKKIPQTDIDCVIIDLDMKDMKL